MKFKVLKGVFVDKNGEHDINSIVETESELDKKFPEQFGVIDDSDRPSKQKPKEANVVYSLKRRRGGKCDVVRESDGKVVNDAPLSVEKAENLIKSMLS